ncbi:hypothetical protein [Armatimonas sp.]|uniref:hypothetical protein n=1 Tax=Armatimonas sp. TaxID=1872638 RepID=UPI00374FF09F
MKFRTIATIALSLVLTAAPRSVLAQDVAATPVTITAQDAPVRSTLEAFFKQAGIKNYILENGVAGFVTLNLVDQPMESALKLVLRANSIPLTYSKENGVWIVKPRRVSTEAVLAPIELATQEQPASPHFERISLTYLDPADLSQILGGITMIHQFTRFTGGQGFSAGQGFSSGNGLLGRGNGQPNSGNRQPGTGGGVLFQGAGNGQSGGG